MTTEQGTCEVCGKPFKIMAHGQRACKGQCTWLLHKREKRLSAEIKQQRERHAYRSLLKEPNGDRITTRRLCHDCGAPTNNYRCPLCLENWQKLHHVIRNSHSEFCDFRGGSVDTI